MSQNYYYDQQVQNYDNYVHVQNSEQQQINQEIIALPVIETSPPFQKQQPCQLVYVKSSSHISSSPSPSPNDDINNNCHKCNRDLNVSTLNCGNNNNDLFSLMIHHITAIKDHRMKISQHIFELEQVINMLRHIDDQNRK
ncbi:11682_t:CDS:2 [Entrophospora sp. SA101]|nr:11682_t:CDS:2 [Entrophospora sp. SA101]CAJ0836291.1 17629_t:CDS:2 [Entrophospora sp. SA101]